MIAVQNYKAELQKRDRKIVNLSENLSKSQEKVEELSKENQELSNRNQELSNRNQELEEENKRLTELLKGKGESKASKKPKFKANYSIETKTSKGKQGQNATGRCPQSEKLNLVSKTEAIYPPEVEPQACEVRRKQYAWRIIDGKARYVCYEIYGEPGSDELPTVSGLRTSRSEYGIEIILIVAFLHYWIGLSLDHVCAVLRFFTGLELPKSQADSLLNQLSTDWSQEYDTIIEILTWQLVVYIDETGWKVGSHNCYTWVFSTMMYVLFRCGVGRGKAEAEAILGAIFRGIGVSDDYAAYKNLFSQHQLCWSHLLRKAIKLALENPQEPQYLEFLKELLDIYHQAVRLQKDQRLSVGRAQKVEELKGRILQLCTRSGEKVDPEKMSAAESTFVRLQNELVNGLPALFVFVEHPEVEPTNNRSERNVRREAEIRKGGRTSKTDTGAKRRGIIMTVLATLNTRFKQFTLDDLIGEVLGWIEKGASIFQQELDEIKKANPPPAVEG